MDGPPTIQGGLIISNALGTEYLTVPSLTTAQRDALTPVNGMVIYNSTLGKFQRRSGSLWRTEPTPRIQVAYVAVGAVTAETTLASANLGTLADADCIVIWAQFWGSGTAGTKTFRVRVAGTLIDAYGFAAAEEATTPYQIILTRRSTNTRWTRWAGKPDGTTGYFGAGEVVQELSAGSLTITGQKANAGDTAILGFALAIEHVA